MIIATLQFELLVHDAASLKDKRRVVKSVKDRLHREHLVAVAEIARQEDPSVAVMGLAAVGADGKRLAGTLDAITEKLRALTDAELGATRRELLRPRGETEPDAASAEDLSSLAAELAAHFESPRPDGAGGGEDGSGVGGAPRSEGEP